MKNYIQFMIFFQLFIVVFLSFEKITLSWEISRLIANQQNLLIEYENFKKNNLVLKTQFYIENSPAQIENKAKSELGMHKKRPKKILNEES